MTTQQRLEFITGVDEIQDVTRGGHVDDEVDTRTFKAIVTDVSEDLLR